MNNRLVSRALPVRQRSTSCCTQVQEPSLSSVRIATLADRMKALGDQTRLAMLDLLCQQVQPLCVCDITPRFPLNQPTISHHLRLLREAGLIETEKQGIWSYYWATDLGRSCLAAMTPLE